MLVALFALDRPGAIEIRKANREAHLAHLEASGMAVEAGPLLDAEGNMCGSLIIFDAPDLAAVEAWAEADPYRRAGLFERVEIRPWKKVIG
ncbi:MAG: YciI family protein [Alphaproteobacteria bacterium]|nr:MAG: YciI family protein [Alphaproteobacteria bacterium]